MKTYNDVRSTERPSEIVTKETSVFKAFNIHTVLVEGSDDSESRVEFEYDLIEYSKDEYISKLHADLDFMAMELGVNLDD